MASNPGMVSGGSGTAGAVNVNATAFERVLEEFKKDLKKKDKDNFQMTSLETLNQAIGEIQKQQQSERRMQNMTRLKRFIEAMAEYGKVIDTFCNGSQFVPFIWGPIKFLLQATSAFSEAFNELLDAYQRIGDNLPLLLQYQNLFQADPRIGKILVFMYEDILEFHRRALNYFQKPMWKKLYHATWKTFKARFSGLIESMSQHRSLIERQAQLSEIDEARKAREINEANFQVMFEAQDHFRRQAVNNWFRAPSVESDQHHFFGMRAQYPQTGRWLLELENFKQWFDPQFPTIPPLLWLNGKPGAGKTILASLVIEEVQKLNPRPTILFFYCKDGDCQRDNFVSIARGLLAQLLKQNKEMLPYFFEEASNSSDSVLTNPATSKELLDMGIRNCKSVYIILDGIDECSRDERKSITSWFRNLIEELPPSNAEAIRCLFVSQDDGAARKDFAGLSTIAINARDNKNDIKEYSTIWAERIKEKFGISDHMSSNIALNVLNTSDGMFLLAKLICDNLLQQTSIEGLEEELAPDKFPKEVNEAYSRILARIFRHASAAQNKDTMMLLSWLVCAKRPFKWHEIQGAKCINLDEQCIEWDRRRFRDDSKDLCGSLVEVRSDKTVELVHLTAKFFLVEEKHVPIATDEIKLATLCIDYLNLPGFCTQNVEQLIFEGYYAFMDYAVAFWLRHLEAGTIKSEEEDDDEDVGAGNGTWTMFMESLEIFLDKHWASPKTPLLVSKRNSDRLQRFREASFYDTLEQAVVSTRKQLTYYGKMKKEEIALDLGEILLKIRPVLEAAYAQPKDDSAKVRFEQMYGSDLYKCSRFSCNYFHNGFSTREEREQHLQKHDRPFRCTVEGCPTAIIGLATESELEKHMKDTHGTLADQEGEFPAESDMAPPPRLETPVRRLLPPEPKKIKKVFSCPDCSKVFTRKFNLDSHLATHGPIRPFFCKSCGKRFARRNDCNRHENSHKGERYTCEGCGKEFTRADSLRNHHNKSKAGQRCRIPPISDNGLEQENPEAPEEN